MQLKYSFKKEWAHFSRTARLIGVIIAIFSFALSTPLMYKFTGTVMNELFKNEDGDSSITATAAVTGDAPSGDGSDGLGDLLGGMDIGDMVDMYNDAGLMYTTTAASFGSSSMLIIMLILMPAAGGEQKKRAMIVPTCSGLQNKNYLIPKFVIYPLAVFIMTFAGSMTAGGLCNVMFSNNKVSVGIMTLSSLMCAVYCLFLTAIYLSMGLCTSRPGVMTALVYVGQSLLQTILMAAGITDYNPFTLQNLLSGYMTSEDFVLAEELPSILVGMAISLAVSILMFFLALGVLNAKRIDNTEEEKPEF